MTHATETRRKPRIPADSLSNRLAVVRNDRGLKGINEAVRAVNDAWGREVITARQWRRIEDGGHIRNEIEVMQAVAAALEIDPTWLMMGGGLLPDGDPSSAPRGGANTADVTDLSLTRRVLYH